MALMLRPWAFLLFLALLSYDESGLQSTRNGVAQATQRVFLYPQSPKVSSIVSTKYRTAYHFQPPKNWINGMSLCSSFLTTYRLLTFLQSQTKTWVHCSETCRHTKNNKWLLSSSFGSFSWFKKNL